MNKNRFIPVVTVVLIVILAACNSKISEREKMREFGQDYTAAWNSKQPGKMASFYAGDGTLTVNNGKPAVGRKQIATTAQSYMEAFPDMVITMDSLTVQETTYRYYWTFKGTNTGPGGTGNKVDFSGFEEWTINDRGLIQKSVGSYDAEVYQSQLEGNKSDQIAMNYRVLKDVSYGTDADQNMDIYLSKNAKSYGKHNYTIVFLHGGAYYGSDKSQEERYIEPYLSKGLNVVNMNYRLKRGIPLATRDLTKALNYLKANNNDYNLKLSHIIVTGFSAGAQIATNVALAQNNREFPDTLEDDIEIIGVINFSGPVDDLGAIERIFIDHEDELFSEVGNLLFPSEGYTGKEVFSVYEPITYFDENDPPVFLWYGGLDDQIPAVTFENFVSSTRKNKDVVMFVNNGEHSPTEDELATAYARVFIYLDDLPGD